MTNPNRLREPQHRPHRLGRWVWTASKGIVIAAAALGLLVLAAGAAAKANLTAGYAAPGSLIDVGGYRMHLHCTGEGAPTVVMEAGLLDFSVHWGRVQPAVAQFTKVCTYERAGLGWSEASPHRRTIEAMTSELHALLVNGGHAGPFVFVGHSFGGTVARHYVHSYPNAIVGLVLVDSAHEDQVLRLPDLETGTEQIQQQFRSLIPLASSGLLALAPQAIPNRGLPAHELAQYRAILATTDYFHHAIAEAERFAVSLEDLRRTRASNVGDIPLVVLTRGRSDLPADPSLEAEEEAWREMQADLVARSPMGVQVIAEASGHDIHLEQPALVVAAIEQVVRQITTAPAGAQ